MSIPDDRADQRVEQRVEQADATQPVDELAHEDAGSVTFAAGSSEAGAGGRFDEGPDDLLDEPEPLPIASRRRRLSILTAVLALAAVAAAGFYAGVLVQKHQKSSTSSTASALQALASRFGRGAGASTGANGAATGTAGGRGAGGFGGAGGGVRGTVKLIDGPNIYVTDAQGNTVKVATNAGSQVTKTVSGSVGDVKIGDTVVVVGPQGADGTYTAQRVTIGGAGGSGGFGGFRGGGAAAGAGG